MTKDKEKEEVAPQQSVEATQDTNTEANPYAGWMSSVGDRYVQQMNNVAAEKAEYEALLQNMRDAYDNNRSVRQALLQEQKPTYDYDKEKRERNKAAVKAFGDMLSAFTAGAHAYGKNGAGVVPTLAENSPLKEIEKINTMQEEYRKRNEAWKALDVKMRGEEADAEAEAAAALATAKGKDLDEARKAAEKTSDAIDKGLFDMATAEQKAAYDYAKWVAQEEGRDRRHRERLASGNGTKGDKKNNLSDKEKGALMRMFSGSGIVSESTTESPLLSITGKPTGETKKATTLRTKYMPEFSDQDWGNFAAQENKVISLMRNAKKNEGLSEDDVADAMLDINVIHWDKIAKIYNDPANKYTLETVIAYVRSEIDGE